MGSQNFLTINSWERYSLVPAAHCFLLRGWGSSFMRRRQTPEGAVTAEGLDWQKQLSLPTDILFWHNSKLVSYSM